MQNQICRVVECLTREQGVAGVSLTGVTINCVIEQNTFILAEHWFNLERTVPTYM